MKLLTNKFFFTGNTTVLQSETTFLFSKNNISLSRVVCRNNTLSAQQSFFLLKENLENNLWILLLHKIFGNKNFENNYGFT